MVALAHTRSGNFPAWYQDIIKEADLAVTSPVRGCMIIRPNGNGIWERIRFLLNARIEDTGHENLYFPLFIPMSFFEREATITDGFAKEMAVVTHHRLKLIDGKLSPDPESVLTDPLVVRPTSELIIGQHFKESVHSYRDLPLLWNQWANVVRWEMRTRLFLRTAEFLWQEGHTAHIDQTDAMEETMRMLEVYRAFSEEVLAIPVITGEKPEHERFPGAERTFSIEAMMQDGKALQAGTSHYLGTHFAEAQGIKYQSREGDIRLCHTTSWGVSTRLVGGVIMTHGDDDGMRIPPAIAPRHVVIVPILRGRESDAEIKAYCNDLYQQLRKQSFMEEPVRVLLDSRDDRSIDKVWTWIKRGAPLICEIGEQDLKNQKVTFIRRDKPRKPDSDKIMRVTLSKEGFVEEAVSLLSAIQQSLFAEAQTRMANNISTDIASVDDLKAYFGAPEEEEDEESNAPFRGWVRVPWSRPTGQDLTAIVEILKALKLTIRNAPLQNNHPQGTCIFTARPAVEEILISRAY